MTDQDHDLLVRIDERTAATHDWITNHEQRHKDEKASRWKWIAPLYGAVIAGLTKLIFWN